jgi:hypothetical protein
MAINLQRKTLLRGISNLYRAYLFILKITDAFYLPLDSLTVPRNKHSCQYDKLILKVTR